MSTFPFERFNEADVREEIITPLLHRLGFRAGTENDIIRELSLRYPREYIGRKNPKRDPVLRGKADYILEAKGRVRWVIDAKAPNVPIDTDAIEQIFTYANHAEVRAVYFAVCNGRTFKVFRTSDAPAHSAVLSVDGDVSASFEQLATILSPEALIRDFPALPMDTKPPIAPGLRSIARVTNGLVQYERSNVDVPHLREMIVTFRDGALQRDESGNLVAFLNATVPFISLQKLNERLGLDRFEMTSSDSKLSTDPRVPTTFIYRNSIILPAGEEVLNVANWQMTKLPMNITVDIEAIAQGVYKEQRFSGEFRSLYRVAGLEAEVSGSFDIHLA